jgi:hypothetical protein
VFGIAAQLRCTKVLYDNNELTTLCHYNIDGLRADAAREPTKRVTAWSSPPPWPLQNYICDTQETPSGESQLFVFPNVI